MKRSELCQWDKTNPIWLVVETCIQKAMLYSVVGTGCSNVYLEHREHMHLVLNEDLYSTFEAARTQALWATEIEIEAAKKLLAGAEALKSKILGMSESGSGL